MNKKYIIFIVSILLFTVTMFIISDYSYPVFHMMIEFITLFVGISIFIVSLSALKIDKNNLIVRLSPGILVSTIVVIIHALAYEGMDFFVNYDANLPTQLWVISSSMQAVVFLSAIILYKRKVNFALNLIVFSVLGIVLTSLTFLRIFPDCYVVGSGLTTFKIFSEYFTILMYVGAIGLVIKYNKKEPNDNFMKIIIMMTLFIFASFMFTQYAGVFAIQNFLGHIFRAIGLAILYYTIVVNSIRKPLDLLFDQVNKEHQEAIYESAKKTRLILNSTVEGILGVDNNGICTFVNNSLLSKLGYTEEEMIGKNVHLLIHHSYENGLPCLIEDCLLSKSIKSKTRVTNDNDIIWGKDGTFFPVEFSSNPQLSNGKVTGSVVSFKDISKRLQYQETLLKLGYIDDLTGLHNRRYYDEEILKIDKIENYPITMIVCDINGLKFFNDSFGHSTGDELLMSITEIYKEVARDCDLVARMGGDEFVFVLPKTTEVEAERFIKRITRMTETKKVNSLSISASYGYDTIYDDADSIHDTYKRAEDSMYQEKLITLSSIRSNATETILSTLNEKDPSSERHSREVSIISEKIGTSMGLTRAIIQQIHTAGLLHDIGKIIISDRILNKKGELSDKEYREIQKHSEIGFRILNSTRDMRKVSLIVLSHHERWDGLGYPRGINGEKIPIESRIIAVADAYDAMTTKRSYRKTRTPKSALDEIVLNSGNQFDPNVVDAFVKNFETIIG